MYGTQHEHKKNNCRRNTLSKILQAADHKKKTLESAVHLTAIIRMLEFNDPLRQIAVTKSKNAWLKHKESMKLYLSAELNLVLPNDIATMIANFL